MRLVDRVYVTQLPSGSMAMIRDLAVFRSSLFTPVLPEESQVNPGRYGAELAFWLCTRLYQEHRIATSYPHYEDWGWLLSYTTEEGRAFAIHCGNIDRENDLWLISLRAYGRGLFWREKPSFECAGKLITALRRLLEAEEGIREPKWLWIDGADGLSCRLGHDPAQDEPLP